PAKPTTRWMTRTRISGPPFALPNDQLQPGPYFAHGADLDVDEPQRQRDFPHRVLGDVGFDLRRLLRPRDPYEAGRFEAPAERAQALLEDRSLRGENVNRARRAGRARNDAHAARQSSEPGAIFRGCIDRNQRHGRLDPELLRERST